MAKVNFKLLLSEFRGKEEELIPILQRVQEKLGYLSEEAVKYISRFLKISENHIFGVASFYSQFRFTEPGENSIKVCLGTACHVRGSHTLSDAIERDFGITSGQTTEDKKFDFHRVACLGCCALAPVVQINNDIHSKMTVNGLTEILKKYE
jgi:NADH:ubiquinone oxidoreductase subunit E